MAEGCHTVAVSREHLEVLTVVDFRELAKLRWARSESVVVSAMGSTSSVVGVVGKAETTMVREIETMVVLKICVGGSER